MHRKLPQSTVKAALPSNESYESKTGSNRTPATVLWVPLSLSNRRGGVLYANLRCLSCALVVVYVFQRESQARRADASAKHLHSCQTHLELRSAEEARHQLVHSKFRCASFSLSLSISKYPLRRNDYQNNLINIFSCNCPRSYYRIFL